MLDIVREVVRGRTVIVVSIVYLGTVEYQRVIGGYLWVTQYGQRQYRES